MKLWKRILSCVLAVLLTVYLLPLQVMAEELGDPQMSMTESAAENTADTPVEVVGEVLERREENRKEFLLTNGIRQVVIYPAAVHYQEDGCWKDIDNRLLPTTAREW